MKGYKKDLLKVRDIVVGEGLLCMGGFVEGMKEWGLDVVRGLRDSGRVYYVYRGGGWNKGGGGKRVEGKMK